MKIDKKQISTDNANYVVPVSLGFLLRNVGGIAWRLYSIYPLLQIISDLD